LGFSTDETRDDCTVKKTIAVAKAKANALTSKSNFPFILNPSLK
jgi:hypothetical protein